MAVLVAAGLCAGHVACSREPTAVVVAVTTDMVVDGDLDELGLYVGVAGEVKTSIRTPTSAEQPAKLPGTLSILQPSDTSTPVHIRVAGYKKGELKVVRDAITTVPSGQLSLLRVPLSWLASTHKAAGAGPVTQSAPGNVKVKDALPAGDTSFSEFAQFFPGYVSPCAQGQTSNDGECVDATAQLTKISSGDLVREVYGGALGLDSTTGVAEGGSCFDVADCFANEQTLKEADYQNCRVRIPAGLSASKTVNFAVVRNEASGCSGKGCFMPLDWDGKYDEVSGTFTFAPQVCKRIGAADLKIASTRIAVATNCDAKMASRPRCNGLFGAVRDKAPSDPTRAPYYPEPPNPNDGAPVVLPDGATPDAARPDAGPPPPVLLGTLNQVQNPRRIVVANDRVWVRARIGIGFLDARGPSTPTEIGSLPASASGQLDDGTRLTFLAAAGNAACILAPRTTLDAALWCYTLSQQEPLPANDYLYSMTSVGSSIVVVGGRGGTSAQFLLPSFAGSTPLSYAFRRPNGALARPDQRVLFALSDGSIEQTNTPLQPNAADPGSSVVAVPGASFIPLGGPVELALNTKGAYYTLPSSSSQTSTLFAKSFANFGATEGMPITTQNLVYPSGADTSTLAADDNYVYWGGGAAGPMAISTCTARAVTPKALFPSAGAQDNTTYAVARAGAKLYFATNDGRVYSMDPPAPEACP